MRLSKVFTRYAEVFSLAVLLYFSDQLSLWFTIPFAAVLGIIAFLKSRHELPAEASLVGMGTFLSEVSCIFLAYYRAPVTGSLVITGVGVAVLLLIKRGVIVLPETRLLSAGILFLGAVGYVVSAFVLGSSVAAIAMVWLIFAGAVMLLPDSLLVMTAALAVCGVLLLGVGEAGTILVLVVSALVYQIVTGNFRRQIIASAASAAGLGAWFAVYTSDFLFRRVSALSAREDYYRAVQRLFCNYSEGDQIPLICNLARRPKQEALLLLFAPAEPADILGFDTADFTAVADYAYDLARFSTGFYAMILVIIVTVCYLRSIWQHRRSRQAMIPIMLLVQTVIHVFGNCMIGPFSGLPLPFFSYGNNQLIVGMLLLIVLTNAELRGDSP